MGSKKKMSFIIFGLVIAIGLILTNNQAQKETVPTVKNEIVDTIIIDQEKYDAEQKAKAEALANRDPIIIDIEQAINNSNITTATVLRDAQLNVNASKVDTKIAMIYLQWDRKNPADQTRKMLSMQSARLANEIGKHKNLSEIVVFWQVPYHAKDQNIAKFNYSKKNNEWMVDNEWFAPVIR